MNEEERSELMRLAWKAGRAAITLEQKCAIQNAIDAAMNEGWDAEDDDDIGHMTSNFEGVLPE